VPTLLAGIAAKTKFGDILANVDVLHGSSESLLTFSNFLFAFGFAAALAAGGDAGARNKQGVVEAGEEEEGKAVSPALALATLVAVAGAGTTAIAAAVAAAGGPNGEMLHDLALATEPYNALSLPTWAVHVSSVTEWSLAMRLIWAYADVSGNKAWRGLSVAMSPFLASAFAACTFHLFYNAPAINALVPLQALLTLSGNVGCAAAAWRIAAEGERVMMEATASSSGANGVGVGAAGAEVIGTGTGTGLVPPPSWAPKPDLSFALKLAGWSVLGSALVKYAPLAAGDFFFEPSYPKALAFIAVPTVLWSAVVFTTPSATTQIEGEEEGFWANLSMDRIKSFGKAGTLSYVIVELVFWAAALPVVRLALFTTLFLQSKHGSVDGSRYGPYVTNLTPPGSDNPTRWLWAGTEWRRARGWT
jgi:hypothetical protein